MKSYSEKLQWKASLLAHVLSLDISHLPNRNIAMVHMRCTLVVTDLCIRQSQMPFNVIYACHFKRVDIKEMRVKSFLYQKIPRDSKAEQVRWLIVFVYLLNNLFMYIITSIMIGTIGSINSCDVNKMSSTSFFQGFMSHIAMSHISRCRWKRTNNEAIHV